MSSIHNDLATWGGRAKANGNNTIYIDADLAIKAADQIVEQANEIERLKSELEQARAKAFGEAAKLIDEGFDRGIRRKQDMCSHGKFEWEDCESCASTAIRSIAEAEAKDG